MQEDIAEWIGAQSWLLRRKNAWCSHHFCTSHRLTVAIILTPDCIRSRPILTVDPNSSIKMISIRIKKSYVTTAHTSKTTGFNFSVSGWKVQHDGIKAERVAHVKIWSQERHVTSLDNRPFSKAYHRPFCQPMILYYIVLFAAHST